MPLKQQERYRSGVEARVISRINFGVTKRLEPCRHWRGRESALRRPLCYCRLGGAKSRTNRPTTCRVERLSRVASLSCLALTWNFYIWCDTYLAIAVEVGAALTLNLNSNVTHHQGSCAHIRRIQSFSKKQSK